MTEWWQALLLAVIQGVTEFLPISSSAHLILPSQVLGWTDQGVVFDVAVHVGTLLAVVLYFRQTLLQLARGSLQGLANQRWNEDVRTVTLLGVATLPAALCGFLFDRWIVTHLRSAEVIAAATALFALVLWYADARGGHEKVRFTMTAAVIIGLAQALALIPGTSRSGITITAALLLGYSRKSASEFSFLLSIPLILAAGAFEAHEWLVVHREGAMQTPWFWALCATLLAFASAYTVIRLFLATIEQIGMLPFVIYRLLLAAGIFLWVIA